MVAESAKFGLRQMWLQDLEAVSALEALTNTFPWNRNKIRECIEAGYDCWLYCDQSSMTAGSGSIMAYAVVSCVIDEASLLNLCVARQYQGQGIGRMLLKELIARASAAGIRVMHLEVRQSNSRAIRLYESSGFIRVGRRKDYYPADEGSEDALVYSLELLSS
ncbi:MAG: ribosomal protein S18-alanine N-acetyltransferase [Pseudohongiellaceae bacterium]